MVNIQTFYMPGVQVFDINDQFITKVGTKCTDDGQLRKPKHVSIDSEGNLFGVDRGNARMQVFSPLNGTSY